MPEWASNVIAAVCSAGFVTAVFAGYLSLRKQRRDERGDEVTVLHTSIDELRRERDRVQRDGAKRDEILMKLRDDHTAALINAGMMETRLRYMEEDLKTLHAEREQCRQEVEQLRKTVEQLRGS